MTALELAYRTLRHNPFWGVIPYSAVKLLGGQTGSMWTLAAKHVKGLRKSVDCGRALVTSGSDASVRCVLLGPEL